MVGGGNATPPTIRPAVRVLGRGPLQGCKFGFEIGNARQQHSVSFVEVILREFAREGYT